MDQEAEVFPPTLSYRRPDAPQQAISISMNAATCLSSQSGPMKVADAEIQLHTATEQPVGWKDSSQKAGTRMNSMNTEDFIFMTMCWLNVSTCSPY